MYNVTDVPALIPFNTHVSHGYPRGLDPPVPLPEIVVVTELTADTDVENNNIAASDANNDAMSDRATTR
jgi:hypothetical protein